jgi:hypothetical protein
MTLAQANAAIEALNARGICACAVWRLFHRQGVTPDVGCERHAIPDETPVCDCGNGVCG